MSDMYRKSKEADAHKANVMGSGKPKAKPKAKKKEYTSRNNSRIQDAKEDPKWMSERAKKVRDNDNFRITGGKPPKGFKKEPKRTAKK